MIANETNVNKKPKQTLSSKFNVELNIGDYTSLIENATSQKDGTKRLDKNALKVFNKHLSDIEKIPIKLQHQNSRLHMKFTRGDTPYITVNAKCNQCTKCSATYKIYRKALPEEGKHYVTFEVSVFGTHDHDTSNGNKQVRGEERVELANRIFSDHGGSSHAARLHDLALNGILLQKKHDLIYQLIHFMFILRMCS